MEGVTPATTVTSESLSAVNHSMSDDNVSSDSLPTGDFGFHYKKLSSEWSSRFESMGIYSSDFLIDKKSTSTIEQDNYLLAQRHYFMGCYHLQMKEIGRAEEQFLKAHEYDPKNNYILLEVARAKLNTRQYEEARKFTTQIIDSESTNVQAMIIEADSYRLEAERASGTASEKLLAEAVQRLEHARTIMPKNREVLDLLAKVYIQTQNINKIIETYKEIVEVNPKDTYSLLLLGQVLSKLDRNKEAVQYFEKVIEQRRGFLGGYVSLADIYRKLNQNKKALDILKQAILVDPTNTELLKTFEEFLRNIYGNRNQKAILDQYANFAKDYPFNSEVQRIYAERLEGEELFDRAVEQYKKVLISDPENTNALIAIGKISLKQKAFDDAIESFSKAIEMAPDRLELYDAIAAGYIGQSRPEDAMEVYRKAIELNPKSEMLYISLAALHDQEKETDKAIQTLLDGLKEAGEKPELLAVLGRIYKQQGNIDAAIPVWRKAYELTPESIPLFSELISLYVKKGSKKEVESLVGIGVKKLSDKKDILYAITAENYQLEGLTPEAIAYYQKALDAGKNKFDNLARLINIYNKAEDHAESWRLFEKYKGTIPDSEKRVQLEAEIKVSEKKYDEAIALIESLITNKPSELNYYNILVDIYNLAGRFDDSLKVAVRAEKNLDATQKNDILVMRGLTYYKAKRYTDAEKAFGELLKITNGESDDIYFFLGSIALDRKQTAKAEGYFKKAIDLNPLSANALNALGYMYADQNVKLEEAEDLIKSALDINPAGSHIIDSMAWVYYRKGQFEEALKWSEKAVRLGGNDPEMLEHLGDIYSALNRPDEAKQAYQKSLEAEPDRKSVKAKLKKLENR